MPAIIMRMDLTLVRMRGRWAARKREALDLSWSGSKVGRVDMILSMMLLLLFLLLV